MKVSDIRIKIVEKENSKLKAYVSITIDECFVVHDIRVIEGKDGYFVSMPAKKAPDGSHIDIVHPINTETRMSLKEQIVEAYLNALKN